MSETETTTTKSTRSSRSSSSDSGKEVVDYGDALKAGYVGGPADETDLTFAAQGDAAVAANDPSVESPTIDATTGMPASS